MSITAYNPITWPPGSDLIITEKRQFPIVKDIAADPFHPLSTSDYTQDLITLFPPERCVLIRLVDFGKHAICKHAGKTLFIANTQRLSPL